MILEESKIIKQKSNVNYSYDTIKITKSRIDKGLLALPRTISKMFPQENKKIRIFLDNSEKISVKNYTSFLSSSNESRIGGLKKWFLENNIEEGDEIVLQVIDRRNFVYKLLPEKKFVHQIKIIQNTLDNSIDDNIARSSIEKLSSLIHLERKNISFNEFLRLSKGTFERERKSILNIKRISREKTPTNVRTVLGSIYGGLCQVCSFTFIKKDNFPYYEIHHIEPSLGHHPKNLVLVCANCHRQFEYSNVKTHLNEDGWLIKVEFNKNVYQLRQIVQNVNDIEFTKTIFL